VNEDAVVFRQPCIYSLKADENVLAWRCPAAQALCFIHSEVQQQIKTECLVKYRFFFERIDRLEQ
jgi:hypothetical protein